MKAPTIVVSAVNITSGGPLTILNEFLAALRRSAPSATIVALVHDEELCRVDGLRLIAIPWAKRRWLSRIYCEYVYFFGLSKRLRSDIWVSLHDISPNVVADTKVVYCHNPSPFYRLRGVPQILAEPKFYLFTKLYKWLYGINIRGNAFVVVQQEWMRREFERLFDIRTVVAASPAVRLSPHAQTDRPSGKRSMTFVYPTFPRFFKNVEVIGEAAEILRQRGITDFNVILTLSGTENRYARGLFARFGANPNIKFVGRLDRGEIERLYNDADALVFASKLETWGLPITEMKAFGKPILAADLPYAHETVGTYDKAVFFDPDRADELADLMAAMIQGGLSYTSSVYRKTLAPILDDWESLITLILAHHDRQGSDSVAAPDAGIHS